MSTEEQQKPQTPLIQQAHATVDPTVNVKESLNAAVKRLDDLAEAERRRVNDIRELTANYEDKLREANEKLLLAESKRLDSIRNVDVTAVQDAYQKTVTQASLLAITLDKTAAELNSRISQIETAVSQNKGTSGGMEKMWGWIVGLIFLGLAIASFILNK